MTLNLPTISVVIPVLDREDLICCAVASVQRQAGVVLEILVVDDGSTDATCGQVRRLGRSDERIVLLRGSGRGPAAARNVGAAVATGEYLAFLDSDDLCPPGRLRRQADKLQGRPEAAAVVGAILGFDALEADGSPVRSPVYQPHHNAALHSGLFRMRTFRGYGPLDETLRFAEDVDFFLRLLEADALLLIEADVASYYRLHPGNMTRQITAKQRGYLQAYARSIARRRTIGRTRPLETFFLKTFTEDTEIGGDDDGAS